MSFSRSKMNQNIFFWMETFFQNLTCRKKFNSKSNEPYFFQSKISCVVKLLKQNQTHCKIFYSKSAFQIVFSHSRWIITKLLPTAENNLFFLQKTTMTMSWGKKLFLRVCGMCLSNVWYHLFGCCALYVNWFFDGCDDYIICTTNWFIQMSFKFKKWLVYKDFILKDTNLLA